MVISYALHHVSGFATECDLQCYVRKILVVCRFNQEGLGGEAGAVWQKFRCNPPPGKLIAFGIGDLVVSALFVDSLVQA